MFFKKNGRRAKDEGEASVHRTQAPKNDTSTFD